MADHGVISDLDLYRKTTKAQSELSDLVGKYREWKKARSGIGRCAHDAQETDPDLRAMAEAEVTRLEPSLTELEQELQILLLPKDPNDEKNIILEIRKGAGRR